MNRGIPPAPASIDRIAAIPVVQYLDWLEIAPSLYELDGGGEGMSGIGWWHGPSRIAAVERRISLRFPVPRSARSARFVAHREEDGYAKLTILSCRAALPGAKPNGYSGQSRSARSPAYFVSIRDLASSSLRRFSVRNKTRKK